MSDKDYAVWEREFESNMVSLEIALNKIDKIPVVNGALAAFRLGIGIGLVIAPSINIIGFAIKGVFTQHSSHLKGRIIKQVAYTDHGIANIIRAIFVGFLWMAPFGLMVNPPFQYLICSGLLGYGVCIIYDLQGCRFRYSIEKSNLEQTRFGLEKA